MNYNEKVDYFFNKMESLIQEAKEQGFNFVFTTYPNGFYNDEDIKTVYSSESNFQIDVVSIDFDLFS